MVLPLVGAGPSGAGELTYAEKVLATQSANLIGYWMLDEDGGTNADNIEGTAARDGTYGGTYTLAQTGIGDGQTSVLFAGGHVDLQTASLATAYAQGDSAMMIWAKVLNAGVWTDETTRNLWRFVVDGSNTTDLFKHSHVDYDDQLQWKLEGNGEEELPLTGALTSTGWLCWIATVDEGNTDIQLFKDGVQVAQEVHSGPWAGPVVESCIGAKKTDNQNPWSGYLAHFAIWSGSGAAAGIIAAASDLATV